MPGIDLWFFFGAAVIFCAAVVRGFSGFGFSLLAVPALSLFYPLETILAPIFMMELAASLNLLPTIWRHVHWSSVLKLLAGTAIGTPLGVYMLSSFAPAPMQLGLSIFVLVAVLLLRLGYQFTTMPDTKTTVAAGLASGLANGAFAIGGPPVILLYFSSPAAVEVGRASLTFYFMAIDLIGLFNLWLVGGFVNAEAIIRAVFWLPVLIAGVWLGHHAFKRVNEAAFRTVVQILIGTLAVLIAGKAISQM